MTIIELKDFLEQFDDEDATILVCFDKDKPSEARQIENVQYIADSEGNSFIQFNAE